MARKESQATLDSNGVVGKAAARLGIIANSAPIASGTASGDVRDVMLDMIKVFIDWDHKTQSEQSDILRELERASRDVVRKVVEVIRSDGNEEAVPAIVKAYTEGTDIKATLVMKSREDDDEWEQKAISTLHRARGKIVLLSIASADYYMGERAPAQTMADQNALQFEAGSDHPDDDSDLLDEVHEEELTH